MSIDTDDVGYRSSRGFDVASAATDSTTKGATEQAQATEDVQPTDSEDHTEGTDTAETAAPPGSSRRRTLYVVLPALALIMTMATAYLKFQDDTARQSQLAAAQSMQAATDTAIAMLSYAPDTVDTALPAASDRLTGDFRDAYTRLINDVVIPGSKQKNISAVAKIPAVASVSATQNHAVVLVFVNQTITIGGDAPTDNASSVRVSLDKVEDRWLVSQFEPV